MENEKYIYKLKRLHNEVDFGAKTEKILNQSYKANKYDLLFEKGLDTELLAFVEHQKGLALQKAYELLLSGLEED